MCAQVVWGDPVVPPPHRRAHRAHACHTGPQCIVHAYAVRVSREQAVVRRLLASLSYLPREPCVRDWLTDRPTDGQTESETERQLGGVWTYVGLPKSFAVSTVENCELSAISVRLWRE